MRGAEPLVIVTSSPRETARVGTLLGRLLAKGDVVALAGDLGAGKTVLAKGIAGGAGARPEDVRSPTFTLVQRYASGRVPIVHVDAYRLSGPGDLVDLGLEEIFDPGAAVLVEWSTRVAAALPAERLDVGLEHAGKSRRRICFEPRGARAAAIVAKLASTRNGELGTGNRE
jgi:tRNA threonylcarbamoyladenosine biosynthesis protein TsaE